MKTTILFDLDGTLIDSTDAILSSFLNVFEKFGFEKPTNSEIKKYIGHTLEDMFLFLNVNEKYINECVLEYKKNYKEVFLQKTSLLDNALDAIKLANSFAKLGVVTTKTRQYSKKILENFKIMDYFKVLIGREDVIHPKPHKEPIEKALFLMNQKKENSWMIGDTKLDILSSKNANIKSIGVLSGYGKKIEMQQYCDIIKNNSLEAVKHIKNNLPSLIK